MAAPSLPHPSDDTLRAFSSGRLDDAAAKVLIAHLDACPDCRGRATSLSGDTFLHRLRAAEGRSTSPTIAHGVAGVPPQLRDHAQYEIIKELGRGGMGIVYLARNRLMNRLEVLKVVNPQLLAQPGMTERFLREIQSAAQLKQANIVTALAALRLGELLVLAMEYAEGDDLAKVVKVHGPLPLANACACACQAALGLQEAFEKGLVHRDVKPQNLILAREGKKQLVKILDFGLAKATREKDGAGRKLTEVGIMMGTPDYVAPEQIMDAARADIRADIYSLGCTLYFLLTGRPPFQGKNMDEVLQAHCRQQARPLNEVRPDVPAEVAAVVAKMMAKEPAKRYQKPVEVAQALANFAKVGLKPLPPVAAPAAGAKSAAASPSSAGSATSVNRASKQETAPPAAGLPPTRIEGKGTIARGMQQDVSLPGAGLRPTMIEGKSTSVSGTKRSPGRPVRTSGAKGSKTWLLVGAGVAVLLVGVIGLLVSGVFRGSTPEGILVVEVNQAHPDVYVDGAKMAVAWEEGGTTAEIRLRPGTRKVEVKKDGFTGFREEVELQDGEHRVITARLASTKKPNDHAAAAAAAKKQADDVAAAAAAKKQTDDVAAAAAKKQADDVAAAAAAKKQTDDVAAAAAKKETEPPPLAKAPFDAATAQALQRTWANYLKRPVDETLDLGEGVQMEFVLIPPGTFTMGSPKEEKNHQADENAHQVTITKPFYLGKYAVTQEQYARLTGGNPSWFKAGGGGAKLAGGEDTGRFPVESVSWDDADAYCAKLGRQAGRKVRLPTEAEWEYACRAGTTTPFHFGMQLNGTQANCNGNFPYGTQKKGPYLQRTCRVDSYPPNAWGLYDMHGNILQWCADWYGPYVLGDIKDPQGRNNGEARVGRGGSWIFNAEGCRAALRLRGAPGYRNDHFVGLRVCFRLD